MSLNLSHPLGADDAADSLSLSLSGLISLSFLLDAALFSSAASILRAPRGAPAAFTVATLKKCFGPKKKRTQGWENGRKAQVQGGRKRGLDIASYTHEEAKKYGL